MRPLTCRPRTFAVFAASILFVALATPIWLTAQVEQEQPKDQTNYFVKNLDTLDDTWTVAKCMSNASPVFADTRPGAPERTDSRVARPFGPCIFGSDPQACPPGLFVPKKYWGGIQCFNAQVVDAVRGCIIVR